MNAAAKALLKEAVALHKQLRAFKARALPYFPLGWAHICEKERPQALLLADGSQGLLFVWRRQGGERIELSLRLDSARQLYPADGFASEVVLSDTQTIVRLPHTDCARLYRVTLRREPE